MAKTILTPKQKVLLDLISRQKDLANNFYLSGGTALAQYYLHHRFSEDLDFFSLEEIDPMSIQDQGGVMKIEFTYYPFVQIKKPQTINGIKVDSLIDIAVNKTFTLYQQPSSRHFIDLYLIIKTKGWKFKELMQKAKLKFDSTLDPIQMGQQLIKVREVSDYPTMIIELPDKDWQDFWLQEAQNLKEEVLE